MSIKMIHSLTGLMLSIQTALPDLVNGVPLPEHKAAGIADSCEQVLDALLQEPIDPRFVAVLDKEV